MFGVSVSGIKNSQKHIDVTSNNIANANSYGFKKSRAEFADMYANSVYSNNRTAAGMGVQNTTVAQQFIQGSLSGDTGNSLDMAIQGNGFFVLSGPGSTSHSYTRNGAFHVDGDGYIVTATGDYLQGWGVNADGSATSLDLNGTTKIQIPADTGEPQMSSNISIGVNFPADKDVIPPSSSLEAGTAEGTYKDPFTGQDLTADELKYGVLRGPNGEKLSYDAEGKIPTDGTVGYKQYYSDFDPKNSATYSASTSQTIHDSLGRAHTLTYYFIKSDAPEAGSSNSVWNVIPFVDGQPVDIASQNGTGQANNPTMISVPSGSKSSVAGSNYFGFQVVMGTNGEVVSQNPSKLTFVNPTGGPNDSIAQDEVLGNSLRQKLFGKVGEGATNTGAYTAVDKTYENDDGTAGGSSTGAGTAVYKTGNGSLHLAMGIGIDPTQVLNLNFSATQYGSSNFSVTGAPTNDGYATGLLLSINVDENGVIQCEYSNGQRKSIAKVAMADFTNTQGLTKIGESQWKESILSGAAIAKEANQGSAGSIKGSNLELSNVDLTSELVELITAQRNYQANAQSLQTQNTVMDSILNLR